jgi:hypothetical protein
MPRLWLIGSFADVTSTLLAFLILVLVVELVVWVVDLHFTLTLVCQF